MKPQQYFSSDGNSSINHKSNRTTAIGEKFKRGYEKPVVAMVADRDLGAQRNYASKEFERRNKRFVVEDPIRTLIFLGSWSHT